MKKLLFIPAVLVALVFSAYTLSNTSWNVKTDAVVISFELNDKDKHNGKLSKLSATIDFDETNPSGSKIVATVDVNSLNTGNEGRDQHLKGAKYFDAANHPNITFTSSEITPSETGFIAKGALTLKGVTKDVEIPFTFENKGTEGVFKGNFSIFAGDYNVMKRSATDMDKVDITVEVPVTK